MNIIFDLITGPIIVFFSLTVILALSDMVEDYLQKGKYIPITIIFTISLLLSWKLTIGIAICTGIRKLIAWWKNRTNQKRTATYHPNPGSDADYDRWKQECQNQEGNT